MEGDIVSHRPSQVARWAALDHRTRSEDSWIEVSSRPSSSSLSSAADEVVTTGLRVQHASGSRNRRQNTPSRLSIAPRGVDPIGTSSQEDYEESESESDRVMNSSSEGIAAITLPPLLGREQTSPALQSTASEDDDDVEENRTAINYPIRNDQCFTPQPNAFSHPPSAATRQNNSSTTDSYFSPQRRGSSRPSLSTHQSMPISPGHQHHTYAPQNVISPSYNAAALHEEALRTSLSTLLSCAAAARGLSKSDQKRPNTSASIPARSSNRVDPITFRLVPQSALPVAAQPPILEEPLFKPTLRRGSTSATNTSSDAPFQHPSFSHDTSTKRKTAGGRSSSRERRSLKKVRRSAISPDDLFVTPTLLTWLVSAGVVVAISALSFRAGYSMGKEAGRLEGGVSFATDEHVRGCAREATRQSLGLKRSLARSAVHV